MLTGATEDEGYLAFLKERENKTPSSAPLAAGAPVPDPNAPEANKPLIISPLVRDLQLKAEKEVCRFRFSFPGICFQKRKTHSHINRPQSSTGTEKI